MTVARLEKLALAIALGLPCGASLAMMVSVPGRVSTTTYTVAVSLLLGTTIVALNTWKSAQPTGSVARLIYETDTGRGDDARATTRWERWTRRYDRSAARGRIVAMMLLSAATTGLIVATWLS